MRFTTTLSALILISLPFSAQAATSERIVAVVNKGVITESDVKARMSLIALSSGLKPSKDLDEKLRPQIIDMLVDEQIRFQEAERQQLTVTEAEIDDGFAQIARQNNTSPDVFKKALQDRGLKIGTLRDQIKTQLAWTKLIQKRVRPRIDVSDADIDNELQRVKDKIGKDQFRIAEIFLPVEAAKAKQVKAFATKLSEQLKTEPQAFASAARQFSQSPGAAQGKSIGWVMQGALPKEVDAVLPNLAKGSVSSPIETQSGYYIILMQDKRQLSATELPSRDDVMERLGMERMERGQRRLYLDLRSQAFIEKRG